MNTDHVVLTTENGGTMQCLHCHETSIPPLPLPVPEWLDILNAFIEAHRDCLPQEQELTS